MNGRVSAIVTTKNSARTLEACLQSLQAQMSPIELVVIDNFSQDATPTMARRYTALFQQAGPERSRQRNLGARAASGEWLLFVDSDMVLEPEIVEECTKVAGSGFKAVIIPEVSRGTGFWAACKALERSCYVGDDSIEAVRFFQRDLFERLGGFDEALTGEEDWDLTARTRRSGEPVGRTRTPLAHDEGHLRLTETMRTKFYYGRTMARYIRKHPRTARRQLKLFRSAFVRHLDLLGRHPLLSGGMLFMKTCEIAAGAAGTAKGFWAERRR
jgi:glycosyltransferase involved in cell wall biosynthesis